MSFNRSQSTGNCSSHNYEPFMLGTSQYGVNVGTSASAGGFGGRNYAQASCVRDCMQWDPAAGNAAKMGGGGNGGSVWNQGGGSMNSQRTTTSMGYNYTQPKAFVTSGGNGQGEGCSRSQIPCQLAPIGTNPQSLLQPMDPVTLRVTAPTPTMNASGGSGPFRFTIDPSQIYGQQQPR